MKERHWNQISEIVGFSIKPSEELTLEKIINFELNDYVGKFEIVSEFATKETNLEKNLEKMIKEWIDQVFVILEFKLIFTQLQWNTVIRIQYRFVLTTLSNF